MGCDVVAPCFAVDLDQEAPAGSILELLREHTRRWQLAHVEWPAQMWVTVEQCIEGPMRLANLYGCIDLHQAYAATPEGKAAGLEPVLRDWQKEARSLSLPGSLRVDPSKAARFAWVPRAS